jgi:hypothetical protein
MTEQQTEHNMLMEFIQHESRVDVEKELEYPPVALSYGEKLTQTPRGDTLLPIPLGTFGNLSVVSAPPKTKKTFFISLLASVFLSGENNYGGKIKGTGVMETLYTLIQSKVYGIVKMCSKECLIWIQMLIKKNIIPLD